MLLAITGLLQQGIVKIVSLPLFLSPSEYQDNTIAHAVAFANGRWPHAHFHLSPVPSWQEWRQILAYFLQDFESGQDVQETAIILAGQGSDDPNINSDLSKLAHLLYEGSNFGWVDVAFVSESTPTVHDQLLRYQTLGAKQIVVVPYLLFEGNIYQQMLAQVETTPTSPQSVISVTPCLSPSDSLIDMLITRHRIALEDRTLLPVSWEEINRKLLVELEAEHKRRPGELAADEDALQKMLSKIDETLPSRQLRDPNEFGNVPTITLELIFDNKGAVHWEQMFGSIPLDVKSANLFGELALAGGTSHRQELLETVNPDDCLTHPDEYNAVLTELDQGIHTITGLEIVESKNPGWIGVQCDNQEMAIWLVRAIIVENVMVRREENTLYLPAGPHYTVTDEILSIVTVMVKTWRFWMEYITQRQWQDVATN